MENPTKRFTYRWARSLGKRQAELMEEVTAAEITEEMAFDELEPNDPWLRTALMCWVMASLNPYVKKRFKITDFYYPQMAEGKTGAARGLFAQLKGWVTQSVQRNKLKEING